MKPDTILVVDDEPVNRRLARAVLTPLGYRLLEACDGEEALETVRKEIPDLILLDIRMPKRDGYSVCKELKQNLKTKLVPIIMTTSLHQVEDKIKGIELGVDDFLIKPLHIAELTSRVRSLLSLKHYTDELENASVVLKGIAGIVEHRDAYTGYHCERVGGYGATIALTMGLPTEDIKYIRLAGLFHDLGKISIPDSILRKPGSLSEEERQVMMTHAVIGEELVSPMKTMIKVLPFIRHHHERLDGSGYPDGWAGKKIPMAVRILSVVDIYDALATDRPYKKAFPREKCLSILREEGRRGWWDADVIERLAEILPSAHS